MFTLKKKVVIYRKADTSYFAKVKNNSKVLPVGANKIGSSINAVKVMTRQADMMASLMPNVLGISDTQQDFTRRVTNYWDSLSVNIPETGKIIEIGLIYNIDSKVTKKNILELKDKDDKVIKFTTSKHLCNYVEANVPEEEKWKYATPIEVADYLLWRYSLNYADVANSIDARDKSPNIRLYIHNESDAKRIEADQFAIRKEAGKIYYDVIEDMRKVDKYLFALNLGASAATMDDLEKHRLFEKEFNENPHKLIAISKDKLLDKKAFVEECITKGVLRRLPNSSVIVHSSDNTPIGDTMEDAIAYLDVESNIKVKNEIEGQLRSLKAK